MMVKHFKKAGRGHVWSRPDLEGVMVCGRCGTPAKYNWGRPLTQVEHHEKRGRGCFEIQAEVF